jgi:uncharacterized protein (DUF1499 family)
MLMFKLLPFLSLLLAGLCWLGGMQDAIAAVPNPVPAAIFSFPHSRPQNLGLRDGQFVKCPTTPNCVSSFSTDETHKIASIKFTTSPEQAFTNLKKTIESLPRTQIITESDNYLYAEFTSKLMGFVDDVEFYLDKAANVIQVRSASRLGESDLGVNRQRIEQIRSQLQSSAS